MFSNTKQLATAGIFAGFIFLLAMTPVGLIPLGFINLTIVHIPVIIGAMVFDRKTSVILGGAFGLASTLTAFGLSLANQSGLCQMLIAEGISGAIEVVIMSMIPRMLIPITTRCMFDLMTKCTGNVYVSSAVAAVVGSVTNTVLYLGLMGAFLASHGLWGKFAAIITGMLILAATCEAIVAAVIAAPTVKILKDHLD